MIQIWEEEILDVGDEEKKWKDLRNKRVVFYPEEARDIIRDVLKTLEKKNIADFGGITDDVLMSIMWITIYATNESDQKKHLKKEELANIRVLTREEARSIIAHAGREQDILKYLILVWGEKWDLLTREEKVQTIIHEFLHLNMEKPDNFKKHDRFDREYKLMEKYLEAKEEEATQKEQIVAVAGIRKKKKLPEEERD